MYQKKPPPEQGGWLLSYEPTAHDNASASTLGLSIFILRSPPIMVLLPAARHHHRSRHLRLPTVDAETSPYACGCPQEGAWQLCRSHVPVC